METITRVLSTIWNAWKKVGRFIGDVVGRAFLMLFYFTIALPFGLGTRLFGDPLDIRRGRPPAWVERVTPVATLDEGHRQF
jgi:hypothetical protein